MSARERPAGQDGANATTTTRSATRVADAGGVPEQVDAECDLSIIDQRRLERRLRVMSMRESGMPIRAPSKNTVLDDLKALRLLSQIGTVEPFEGKITGLNGKTYRPSGGHPR